MLITKYSFNKVIKQIHNHDEPYAYDGGMNGGKEGGRNEWMKGRREG